LLEGYKALEMIRNQQYDTRVCKPTT
jgi:hypothetical protein